jgi:F-type H+-transporting ATPase subunit epsilon
MNQKGKILLQIVTPYEKVVNEYVDEVRVPGVEGELGILYGHAPLLTSLHTGEVGYKIEGKEEILCVSWGFAEVLYDKVTLLVETAEVAHKIDLERAVKAKEKAEAILRGDITTEQEYIDANMTLKKAVSRISIGSKIIK